MKKLLVLLPLLLLYGCPKATTVNVPPPPNADWTVTINFTYDFTNFVPCSATVTSGCISGFTWGYMSGTSQVPLKTSPANVCSGTTQPENCTDVTNATVGIGNVVPFVTANGKDNSGNAVSSSPANGPGTTVAIGAANAVAIAFK